MRFRLIAFLLLASLVACASEPDPLTIQPARRRAVAPSDRNAVLDEVEHRTFQWFWDTADPATRLVPDRWPTVTFSSIAAVGFGLTAYGIGAERGYVTREQAADRALKTLQFFLNAPTGPEATGRTGYKGFYYHFLYMNSGARYKDVELSTVDTSLLLAGVLFCQSYFDRDNETERAIRAAADELYGRADWTFFLARPPAITMGWTPEHGQHTYDWRGYNEAMIVVLLALGSPTHPVDASAWAEYQKTYQWGTFYGQPHLMFPPLFGHQYSHVWIDFRGIQDDYMRSHGIDYFENSKRATIAQRSYAIANPGGYRDYGPTIWGLSACDGPMDATITIDGTPRLFHGYAARGADASEVRDDGTIAPTAAISSMPFTPDISFDALNGMRDRYGDHLYGKYGFLDAFNPTLRTTEKVQAGTVDPQLGWFDVDYLGIDQGPILAMIENSRSELVWKTMRKNPHVIRGLQRAGFTGGWLSN
ncbi:MAG: glucoamylase family protein [Thermoanaerobaculia bacterium]